MNSGAVWPVPKVAKARVLGIQRKLHKWAQDDQDRRFSDFDALGWLDDTDRKRAGSVGPKQRDDFKKLFGPYGTKPWTRRSVPKLLEEIEDQWDQQGRDHLWAMHDVANRHSNQVLHSTPFAAGATATAQTEDALHLTIGASNQFVPQALLFGYWTYGQVFSLLIKVFRISSRAAFHAVWQPGGDAFR